MIIISSLYSWLLDVHDSPKKLLVSVYMLSLISLIIVFSSQPPNGHTDLRKLDLSKVKEESVFMSLKHPKDLRYQFSKSSPMYGYDQSEADCEGECADAVPSGEVVLSVVVFHPFTVIQIVDF